jgi:Acetyltransferase (GNAT) family
MSEIRIVTREEIPLIPSIGTAFFEEAKLLGEMRHPVFIRNWTNFYDLGLGVIIGIFEGPVPVGVIGGLCVNDVNDDQLVASEMFWYVLQGHRVGGIKLVKAFETWAKEKGAKRVSMVHLCGDNAATLGKYYQKIGYVPTELHYLKALAS